MGASLAGGSKDWADYVKKNGYGANPTAKIKINKKDWNSKDIIITNVEVSSSVGTEASTCFVELKYVCADENDNHFGKLDFKMPPDFASVKVGTEIEVELGYGKGSGLKSTLSLGSSKEGTVFIGYISAFDIEIDNEGMATLTVQGMDAKMWMMANKKTELKKKKHKYSQIVKDVYNDYSSKLKGKNVKIKSEAKFKADIYQQNESDYEFLSRISKLTGSMFFIDRGEMNFVSISALKSTKLKIEPHSKIYNVKMSASVWGIPKSVEFVSIDKKNYKKVISAKATNSENIGSGKNASSLTKNINSVNTIKVIDNTLSSVSEAKFLAKSIYNQREINLIELEIKLMGYPPAKLGTGVKLKGFGNPIDNSYIITGIKHYCDFDKKSYISILSLKTNRVNPQSKGLPF